MAAAVMAPESVGVNGEAACSTREVTLGSKNIWESKCNLDPP